MLKADLHIHSAFSSDGEYAVNQIVEKCLKQKIELFSITDHNTVGATEQASELSSKYTIDFIPGIEIDCNYQGADMHLLGYDINWQSTDFYELEKDISKKVLDSFSEMIYNLHKLGIDVAGDEVLKKANGKLSSAELIAEVLLSDKKYDNDKLIPYKQGGNRSDMPYLNFYLDFFAQGKPAYVEIDYMDYPQAIQLVLDNGGMPIIAHPGLNFKGREQIVVELLDNGAQGIEVFNNYHDSSQVEYFADIALKKNALMTCGSDFHGKTKPTIKIGNYNFDNRYTEYLTHSLQIIRKKRK